MDITYIHTPSYDCYLEDSRERTESLARRARIAELEEIQSKLVLDASGMSFEEFEAKLDSLREEMDYHLDEEYPDRNKEDANRKVRIIKLEQMQEDTLSAFEFGCSEAQAEYDSIRAELDALCDDDLGDLDDHPF